MAIDLNGLSAKELDTLITKAKARKTTLKKRKPVATVRSKLRQLDEAEGYTIAELFGGRSEEHTSELQSLMRISYAVFCLNKKIHNNNNDSIAEHPIYH